MRSPRSLQPEEVLRALAEHERHGIKAGVWHLLVTPSEADVECGWSLCHRFGLSQEQLEVLLLRAFDKADLSVTNLSTSRESSFVKAFQKLTGVAVPTFRPKSGQHRETPIGSVYARPSTRAVHILTANTCRTAVWLRDGPC